MQHYQAAAQMHQAGDYPGAEKQYHQCLRVSPRYSPAYNGLGILRRDASNLPASLDALKLAVKFAPRDEMSRANLIATHFMAREPSEAESHLRKQVKFHSNNLHAYRQLAAVAKQRRAPGSEQLALHGAMLRIDPLDFESHLAHAQLHGELRNMGDAAGDARSADSSLRSAIRLQPKKSAILHNERGKMLAQAGENALAREACSSAVVLAPSWAPL